MPKRPKPWQQGRAGNRKRFPGITADAKTLGVNRITLYRVLRGDYPQLKSLLRRYEELKRSQIIASAK